MNQALRAHVTRVGFDLTLGRTHIAALVMLDEMLRRNSHIYVADGRSPFSMWATGMHGLTERGLVERKPDADEKIHRRYEDRKDGKRVPEITVRAIWRITNAGRLVIQLLQESGVYEEYATDLVKREKRTKARQALRSA